MNRYRRDDTFAGLGLLETVVASMIFISVVVVLATVWAWYGKAVASSRYVLVGTQLGEELIEQCVGAGYERVEQLVTTGGTPREVTLRTRMRDQWVEVTYRTVVEVEMDSGDELKRVRVCVSWEDETGPEEIAFETLLFNQK